MITPPTERYLAALRHAHRSHLRVTLFDGGIEVGPLPVTSCTLTIDGQSNVWRTGQLGLGVDLWDTDTRDYLEQSSVEQGEVRIEHGILFADEIIDWVEIAYLKIDQLTATLSSSSRAATAFDRAIFPQEHLLETGRPLNDTYVNMITTMLRETLPGESLIVDPGIDTLLSPSPGKVLSGGGERLGEMQTFAEALGAWLYNEPDGGFRLSPYEAPVPTVVWDIDAGEDGVMIDATEEFSRREQFNAVGVEFTPAEGNDWKVLIFRWDNDPTSPTYYDGPFGKKPKFFAEEYDHLPSTDEALVVANRKLAEHSGATRSLTLEAVYNPLLLPGDFISVGFPDGTAETHVIDVITMELGPSARMSVDTRLVRDDGAFGTTVTGSDTGTQELP